MQHVEKLETLTRLLDNDVVKHSDVMSIQDDLAYYIESHRDPDFLFDLSIYEQFEALEAAEEGAAAARAELERERLEAEERERKAREAAEKTTKPKKVKLNTGASASASSSAIEDEDVSTPAEEVDEATAVEPSVAAEPVPMTVAIVTSSDDPPKTVTRQVSGGATSLAAIVKASPAVNGGDTSPVAVASVKPVVAAPPSGPLVATSSAPSPAVPFEPTLPPPVVMTREQEQAFTKEPVTESAATLPAPLQRVPGAPVPAVDGVVRQAGAMGGGLFGGGSSLLFLDSDDAAVGYMVGVQLDPEDTDLGSSDPEGTGLTMLHRSLEHVPETADLERQRTFVPRTPIAPHIAFPVTPLAQLDDASLFSSLPTDSLFFAFYYLQGTRQQQLAAKELLSRSWRFHSEYGTWFQRYDSARTKTETSETGACTYFDFEQTWSQRVLKEFTFRYDALESSVQ
jgi:CCR4-NOT transcription complex subunit 3